MKYLVTDDFVAAHGWTPDKVARALQEPLAKIGVHVERVRRLGDGGFQCQGLAVNVFTSKKVEVVKLVTQVVRHLPDARDDEWC